MTVDHDTAHTMIAALSASPEGRELVEELENLRYYHRDGLVYDMGRGSMLVSSYELDSDGEWFCCGRVLLPGKRDKLNYTSVAWRGGNVEAALFWPVSAKKAVVIPRVLGEWATELILEHGDTFTPAECKGVACIVDGHPGMAVTVPSNRELPGLTRDKWARKRAFQRHYHKSNYDMLPALFAPGYHLACDIVYGVCANYISNCVSKAEGVYGEWTPEDLLDDSNVFAYISPRILRASCQVLSDYKQWEYFDTCSPLQCARHLVAGDYSPRDLSKDEVIPRWERRAAERQNLVEV